MAVFSSTAQSAVLPYRGLARKHARWNQKLHEYSKQRYNRGHRRSHLDLAKSHRVGTIHTCIHGARAVRRLRHITMANIRKHYRVEVWIHQLLLHGFPDHVLDKSFDTSYIPQNVLIFLPYL